VEEDVRRVMSLAMSRRVLVTGVVVVLALVVGVGAGVWFWGVLVEYVDPKAATGRKDVVQVYALIVAGVVGIIGAAVALANLYFSRMNLQHNREALDRQVEVEASRTQDAALQAYYEQMGKLLIEDNLREAELHSDLRLLAEAETVTVLREINPTRKGQLISFLARALLIHTDDQLIVLASADLRHASLRGQALWEADFSYADLSHADLREADLSRANLAGTTLIGADLRRAGLGHADLALADLTNADVTDADLSNAKVTDEQLRTTRSLKNATMPNGQTYEDWLKSREEDGESSDPP